MLAGGQAQVLNPEGGGRSGNDGGIMEKGVPANSFVYYEIDENESKHLLSVDNYGQQEATDAWVLLEEEKE